MAKSKAQIIDSVAPATIDVKFNSKDSFFKLATEANTAIKFQVEQKTGYNEFVLYVKDGDNLKIVTAYHEAITDAYQSIPSGAVKKTITYTILDYFAHKGEYDGDSVTTAYRTINKVLNDGNTYTVLPDGTTRITSIYPQSVGSNKSDKYDVVSGESTLYDFKGNESYNIAVWAKPDKGAVIYDYAGNDKYLVSVLPQGQQETVTYGGATTAVIYDYAGNDSYTLREGSKTTVHEATGNDKYSANGAKEVTVTDSKGADTYNLSNITDKTAITDDAGNDKYTLNGVRTKDNHTAITDKAGNDKYTLISSIGSEAKEIVFNEQKGNDSFAIAGSSYIEINDVAGNDKYTVQNSDNIYINDKLFGSNTGGKESYTLTNVSNSIIDDYVGNDTYKLTSNYRFNVTDYAGSDKYTVADSVETSIVDDDSDNLSDTFTVKNSIETIIVSNKGNDKFTVSNNTVDLKITDYEGNETYNIKDTEFLKITDNKGDDKYNLTNVDNYALLAASNADDAMKYNVQDTAGKDNYNIKNSRHVYVFDDSSTNSEQNTFNVTSSESIRINADEKKAYFASNKYNINSSTSVYVYDYGADDTYTLKNSTGVQITDYGADDTYTLKNSTGIIIYDKSQTLNTAGAFEKNTFNILNNSDFTIYTNQNNTTYASNDTYNITSSSGYVWDEDKADDTYKVNKLNTKLEIYDANGNDSLTISSGKANNLVFMASDYKTGTLVNKGDAALYIYDKANKGFVAIQSYFKYDDDFDFTAEKGKGEIETIKLGKKDITATITTYDKLNQYKADCAAWMSSQGYTKGISEVLERGNQADIDKLVAVFSGKDTFPPID